MRKKGKQTMKHAWSILQPCGCIQLLQNTNCFPAALATLQTLRLPKDPSFQARPQLQWGSCNYTVD